MKQLTTMLVAYFGFLALLMGQPIKITFDGPPIQPRNTVYAINQYTEADMLFKPFGPIDLRPPYRLVRNGGGYTFDGLSVSPENYTTFIQAAFGCSLEFFYTKGSAFNLISVDLAEYSVFVAPRPVTFIGTKIDGTIVSTNFVLDGIIDGGGLLMDFQTFSFGPEFTQLVKVEVPTEGYSLDNLFIELDSDGDGVPDSIDECINTPLGSLVNDHGCSIPQLVPCEGPRNGGAWKNHGHYVSTLADVTRNFVTLGILTGAQRNSILQTAAQSSCGKTTRISKFDH
jgi:hypothetical protein